ncbi:MAG: hypothetical protein FJZ47_11300 [Candidatus Tectomicrobia bacterium]|uniref:DNA primase/polymerase bifunctional N-terminal domain-containing protein n=1 Tax=Tectimicrobiota bacterium TaxID=2528274 RepID=A0A937W287_UNCTE|nr:hypothetical protein [Candidatus Tectomicrobia bacterium]
MSNVTPNLGALRAFFELVYGAMDEGWLVVSFPSATRQNPAGKPRLDSAWYDLRTISLYRIAQEAAASCPGQNCLPWLRRARPVLHPASWSRGKKSTAYAVPGLWFDLDLVYGQHAASALPATDDAALEFFYALPAEPSLVIHSGGGLYGWWLFREPFIITDGTERTTITHLSAQFTATLVAAGTHHSWTLDALGDLARVLRPPGSINSKYGRLVETLHESGARYNPSDFGWLLPLPPAPRVSQALVALTGQPGIVLVAEHYGIQLSKKSATELCGAHPVHGSSTGSNFSLNPAKQVWHCHRHTTGGGSLALIAVCEGLLPCEAASPGAIRGALFRDAVRIAQKTFRASMPSPPVVRSGCWGNPFANPLAAGGVWR